MTEENIAPEVVEDVIEEQPVVEEQPVAQEQPTYDDPLSSRFVELKKRERGLQAEVEARVKAALEEVTADPINKLK